MHSAEYPKSSPQITPSAIPEIHICHWTPAHFIEKTAESAEHKQTRLSAHGKRSQESTTAVICRKRFCSQLDPEHRTMQYRFYIPESLQPLWKVLVTHYRPYLPDIQMDSDSFVALPGQAVDLLQELRELAGQPVALQSKGLQLPCGKDCSTDRCP